MLTIQFVRFATPRSMTRDAYQEFCWGAHLPETPDGYGLFMGYDDDYQPAAAVTGDVEYARLLKASGGGIEIPADKVISVIPDWPNLRPDAASVWG